MSEDTRTYELAYIIVPTVPESEVTEKVTDLKNAITAVEGTVASEGAPEFIDLAYQIEKNVKSKKMKWNQGYFGWMKFTAAPDKLEALKKAYDGNLDLMRYMLIKTDIENNVVFKKPKIEAKRGGEVSFDAAELETIAVEMDEAPKEAEAEPVEGSDDTKEHHEKLPSLEDDIITKA